MDYAETGCLPDSDLIERVETLSYLVLNTGRGFSPIWQDCMADSKHLQKLTDVQAVGLITPIACHQSPAQVRSLATQLTVHLLFPLSP